MMLFRSLHCFNTAGWQVSAQLCRKQLCGSPGWADTAYNKEASDNTDLVGSALPTVLHRDDLCRAVSVVAFGMVGVGACFRRRPLNAAEMTAST